MIRKILLACILLFLLMSLLTACGGGGGGGGGDDDDTASDPDPNSNDNIAGFNFTLNEGDYWEYGWDYYVSIIDSNGGTSSTKRGVFRLTLGAPTLIDNKTAFPLIMTGNNRQDVPNVVPFVTPRWTHIAVVDNKIMMSDDGIELKTVFDANTGYVIGFGIFEVLSENSLFETASGSLSNDYITSTDSIYVITDIIEESRCEYFEGYGTICGTDESVDLNVVRKEFYQADIGPVGFFYDSSTSTGGTFDSVDTIRTIDIGLIASSLRGDIVNYDLETEPNNTPDTASPVTKTVFPVTMKGDLTYQADIDVTLPENYATTNTYYTNSRSEVEPNNFFVNAEAVNLNESINGTASVTDNGEAWSFVAGGNAIQTKIEDWYEFSVTPALASQYGGTFPFDINLDFFDAAGSADFDIYLFNSNGVVLEYSFDANTATDGTDNFEYMRPDLPQGLYTIGVDAWTASDAASRNYTLSITQTQVGDDPDISNIYRIADFYKVSITSTKDLTVTASPALGVFLTNSDGTNVLTSAFPFPSATNTTLIASALPPDTYLIALGTQEFGINTYELNISVSPPGSN